MWIIFDLDSFISESFDLKTWIWEQLTTLRHSYANHVTLTYSYVNHITLRHSYMNYLTLKPHLTLRHLYVNNLTWKQSNLELYIYNGIYQVISHITSSWFIWYQFICESFYHIHWWIIWYQHFYLKITCGLHKYDIYRIFTFYIILICSYIF